MPGDSWRYAGISPVTTTWLTLATNSFAVRADLTSAYTPRPHAILELKPCFVDRIVQVLLAPLGPPAKNVTPIGCISESWVTNGLVKL